MLPLIILSVIIFIILHFNHVSSVEKNYLIAQKNYKINLEKYHASYKDWEKEISNLKNDNNIINEFRKTTLVNYLKRSSKPAHIHLSHKGHAEPAFYETLVNYFGDRITINRVIPEATLEIPYQPDFIYHDSLINLYVDIEIDEPYVMQSGKPIHYRIGDESIDDYRNNYFNYHRWVVIRFAEEQIIRFPKECCKYISDVISDKFIIHSSFDDFNGIGRLKRVKQWTEEEAKDLYNNNFRQNLISNSKLEKANNIIESDSLEKYREGISLFKREKYLDAIECFNISINLNPNHYSSYYQRALTNKKLLKFNDAIDDLKYLITHSESKDVYYNQAGVCFYANKNYKDSIEQFSKALELCKKDNYLKNRASAYKKTGDFDKAIEDIVECLKSNPKDEQTLNQAGVCFYASKKYKESIEQFSKAIKLNRKDTYLKNRAKAYKYTGDLNNAVEDFIEYLDSNPEDDQTYNEVGCLFKDLGKFEEASKYFGLAINISPSNIEYLNNRGVAHLLNHDIEKASIDFNAVIDYDKNDIFSNSCLDFIESTFFGSNLNLIQVEKDGINYTSFTNNFTNFNMALFDFLKKNPLLQKWEEMSEYWKNHFRAEIGFRGTPKEDVLNKILSTKSLELNMRGLKDLSIVRLLPSLEDLRVGWNPIQDLSPIESCVNLKVLIISGTQISDITPLSNLTKLETLHMMQTPVEDIDSLSNLSSLKELIMSETNVADIDSLKELKNLEFLNIENTSVFDLRPLHSLHKLRKLWADYIDLDEDNAEDEIEELLQNLPDLELMHSDDDDDAPSVATYLDEDGRLLIDNAQFDSALNDPERHKKEYQIYLKIMNNIKSGKIKSVLDIPLEDLEIFLKFSNK